MIRRLQTEKKTNLTESPTNKQTDENKNSHVLIKIIIPNEPLNHKASLYSTLLMKIVQIDSVIMAHQYHHL